MFQLGRRGRKLANYAITFFFTLATFYFLYYAVGGNKGLFAWMQLTSQVEKARAGLDTVKAEKLNLSHRVELLKSGSIDEDMLDEQARKQLGYAGKNEIVLKPEE